MRNNRIVVAGLLLLLSTGCFFLFSIERSQQEAESATLTSSNEEGLFPKGWKHPFFEIFSFLFIDSTLRRTMHTSPPESGGCGRPSSNYPSGSAMNCSYNGVCQANGECSCFVGWSGMYCESLDLLPASNNSGLNLLHETNTSTWGGSVLYDAKTQLYHMFASEILHHCGIHRWVTNSIVVRATSRGPQDGWKFTRQEVLWDLFSHEPIVVRDPTSAEVAVFLTHYPGDASDCPTCYCTDGNSASGYSKSGESCKYECGGGANKSMFSYFSFASDMEGEWSNLTSLCRVQMNGDSTCDISNSSDNHFPHVDMNLAPILHGDGSVLAWTRWHIWEATNWKDPNSYVNTGYAPDFNSKPYPTPWEGEDPSIWMDKDGIYHMISHNGHRGEVYPHNASGDCGRHFFSETGKAGTWRVAPLLPPKDLGGCAYLRTVPFEDGSMYTFYRRERPHVILGPDGVTPVALSTSVIDSPENDMRDASYTLVQAVRATRTTSEESASLG